MPRKLIRPNIPPDSCNHMDRVIELADAMINETDSEVEEIIQETKDTSSIKKKKKPWSNTKIIS